LLCEYAGTSPINADQWFLLVHQMHVGIPRLVSALVGGVMQAAMGGGEAPSKGSVDHSLEDAHAKE
jgi:hypothetical protein